MTDISTGTQDKQRSALDALTAQTAAQAAQAQAQPDPQADPSQVPAPLQAAFGPQPTADTLAANTAAGLGPTPPDAKAPQDNAYSVPDQSAPINQGDAADRSLTDLEARADSPNEMPEDVAARSAIGSDASEATPAKESWLKKLGKIAGGAVGYGNPSDPDAQKGAGIMNVIGRLGRGTAAAMGTPEQKQIAEDENKTAAELPLRLAAQQNLAAYHNGTLGINQQKADVDQQKADAIEQYHEQQAREKGYKVDPTTHQLVPMSIDERLADPTISINDEQKKALIMGKQAETALAQAHQQAIANPNSPAFRQKEEAIQDTYKAALARIAVADKMAELAGERLSNNNFRTNLAGSEAGLKVWGPAMDSGERLQVMRQNYQDALKNHDQQAMLSLLANHLGMTMGLQKGARINQAIIQEAQNSLPYLQGLQAKFDSDGYLTGVNLAPNQMKTMVALGESRYRDDVQKARYQGEYAGLPEPRLPIEPSSGTEAPLPPAGPSKRQAPITTPNAVPSFKDWKQNQGAQ